MKKLWKILGTVFALLLVAVIGYLAYVLLSYHRLEDQLPLSPEGEGAAAVPVGEPLSLVTYNVGFGAYSDDYSFFMDGGEHARAFSEEAVRRNIGGALKILQEEKPDFVFLQEVDTHGTRSHYVDEKALFTEGLPGYATVFAPNYDSAYLFYPFHQPIGANRSGILTASRYTITSAVRRSLPVEDSLSKFLDLDRAYSVSVLKTDSGRELLLYHVHLSAYTTDGSIAAEQLKMLSADMKAQYEKGNYVIAAGDFNKDLLGDSSRYFARPEGMYNWATPFETQLLPEGFTCHTGKKFPTCRNADKPYQGDGGDFVLSVDGVIVSPNVQLSSCETVEAAFAYSDHNPVKASVVLLGEE